MLNLHQKIKTIVPCLLMIFSVQSLATFQPLTEFGDNPGELSASYFANHTDSENLVVLLHGCVQSGQSLAEQSGFLALAKQHNFALLMPQQSQSNNIKNCFNWFSEQDTDKNSGETLSLVNMINTVKTKQQAKQVFVVGLSAGGAMASSLVVNYPELFTAGAIVAGIPYPCANNLIKAISCMRSGPSQSADELTQAVLSLSNNDNNWPPLSIWTGSKDNIVHPKNAKQLAKHWAKLTASTAHQQVTKQNKYQITQWKNKQDQLQVELIEIDNLGHGMAVNSAQENGGITADFLLESPLSSALHIIDFWQIN